VNVIVHYKTTSFLYIDVVVNTSDTKFNIANMEYQKLNSFKALHYVKNYL
jgi:hypothetical protein